MALRGCGCVRVLMAAHGEDGRGCGASRGRLTEWQIRPAALQHQELPEEARFCRIPAHLQPGRPGMRSACPPRATGPSSQAPPTTQQQSSHLTDSAHFSSPNQNQLVAASKPTGQARRGVGTSVAGTRSRGWTSGKPAREREVRMRWLQVPTLRPLRGAEGPGRVLGGRGHKSAASPTSATVTQGCSEYTVCRHLAGRH